jgi:hypothetical protein
MSSSGGSEANNSPAAASAMLSEVDGVDGVDPPLAVHVITSVIQNNPSVVFTACTRRFNFFVVLLAFAQF